MLQSYLSGVIVFFKYTKLKTIQVFVCKTSRSRVRVCKENKRRLISVQRSLWSLSVSTRKSVNRCLSVCNCNRLFRKLNTRARLTSDSSKRFFVIKEIEFVHSIFPVTRMTSGATLGENNWKNRLKCIQYWIRLVK